MISRKLAQARLSNIPLLGNLAMKKINIVDTEQLSFGVERNHCSQGKLEENCFNKTMAEPLLMCLSCCDIEEQTRMNCIILIIVILADT